MTGGGSTGSIHGVMLTALAAMGMALLASVGLPLTGVFAV
jgi:hypothetical protein